MATQIPRSRFNARLSDADQKIVEAVNKKLGGIGATELFRRAIRALAIQEKVRVSVDLVRSL